MSRLIEHANRELDILGMPRTPEIEEGYDIDYDYEIRKSIMDLVEKFSEQGHSGMSASIVIRLLPNLLDFKALSPLTDDYNEWQLVGTGFWQNVRDSECFSKNGGITYYALSEQRKWVWRLVRSLPRWMTKGAWEWRWLFYPMHASVKTPQS